MNEWNRCFQPNGWRPKVRLIETFYRTLGANQNRMGLALSAADVRRIVGEGKLAVVLALEGGFDTEFVSQPAATPSASPS